jgi:hypothetical protein
MAYYKLMDITRRFAERMALKLSPEEQEEFKRQSAYYSDDDLRPLIQAVVWQNAYDPEALHRFLCEQVLSVGGKLPEFSQEEEKAAKKLAHAFCFMFQQRG